jgi:hypothetical protein
MLVGKHFRELELLVLQDNKIGAEGATEVCRSLDRLRELTFGT